MRNKDPFISWTDILLFVLLLLAGLAALIIWPPRRDLSGLSEAGMYYDVRILRDIWGVPHILGKTDPDAAYGLAYAHAEDDFLTIQQTLLAARGELASLYGIDAAANDYMVGLLRIWDVVEAGYDRDLDRETQEIAVAYAEGLNHYAALHQDEVLTDGLFPLSGKDIVAASVHKSPLFFDLDDVLTEIFESTRQSDLSPGPGSEELSDASFQIDPRFGSNTFSIGPSRTADGSTFLAVNSHQPWEGPTTWYEAHVRSEEGWNMTGATFPVTPAIIHGHNENLGWAFTVNDPDLADVYVLEMNPEDPYGYRFDGRWLQLERRQAPIRVRLFGNIRWTVYREVLWSVYGPAIRMEHGVYALRYAGYGRVDIFQQLYRMNKAHDLEAWRSALAAGGLPNFNVGYADREGNIYYVYNAMSPVRDPDYDWSLYLPGNTSQTLWTEYMPFEQLPQVLNPPSGFVQNANSTPFRTTLGPYNPDPLEYPAAMGIEMKITNRALRALELFGSDESITFEEFVAYKFDWGYSEDSAMAKLVRQLVSLNPMPDAKMQYGVDILREWNQQMEPESTGATLVIFTLYHLLENHQPIKASALVDAKLSDAAVLEAYQQAVSFLDEKFGKVDVPWGQVNRLMRGSIDIGLGGGPDVLNAVYGKLQPDGRFKGYQGDSYILLAAWDPQGAVRAYSIHQYGSATLDVNSVHYSDQAPLFAQRQLKPAWFTEEDIRSNLESEYRPGDEIQ